MVTDIKFGYDIAWLKSLIAILAQPVTLPSFTRKSNFNLAVSLS